jgi:hypothetical protein
MKRDGEDRGSVIGETVGWLAFVLFVAGVWKVRQTLDRWHREP